MEREGLDVGILTMLDALEQARGALREIFFRMFLCFHISDTSLLPLQTLVARSQNKSRFLREQKAEWDRLSEEARLRVDMAA